jgi:hypothetical protein
MSIKGGSYQRFRRALATGNPLIVRTAAAELNGRLSLADALAVTLVLRQDPRFARAAARWVARLALETPSVSLADTQLANAALAEIAEGRHDAGADALGALLIRLELRDCVAELARWNGRR